MKKIIILTILLSNIAINTEAKLLHLKGFGLGAALGQAIFWTEILTRRQRNRVGYDSLQDFLSTNIIVTILSGIVGESLYRKTSNYKYNVIIENIKTFKEHTLYNAIKSFPLEEVKFNEISEKIYSDIIMAFDEIYVNEKYSRVKTFDELKRLHTILTEAIQYMQEIKHATFRKKGINKIKNYVHKISICMNVIKTTRLFNEQLQIKQYENYIKIAESW